jgi:Xaa-Pro aminopeptidase
MHAEHRSRFLAELAKTGSAAVIPAAEPKIRNFDSEYRYRPDSDFWYLTGFAEPGACLVLLPERASAAARTVLFLRERDPRQEVWTGRRLGVDAAPAALGVDAAYPIGELWTRLGELLAGCPRVVYKTGVDADRDRKLIDVLARERAKVRSLTPAPTELVDPAPTLHELRLKKSPAELARMRRAAAISAEAHRAAMRAAKPGMGEHEIDALLQYTFLRRGATGSAYANIVAGGANACVLHYVQNDMPLRAGELLLIDAGAEVEYYASDVTRTFPIDGRFTADQRALYELVLFAQQQSIRATRPGATLVELHEIAVRVLCAGLVSLGLLPGPAERVFDEGLYQRFYMHRTGHWLGLDVHDCGTYVTDGSPRPIEPGMVLTVEPGLYVAPDDESVEERWRGIGIRIEDDVLVTPDGCEILTAAVPKEVAEVEAACANAPGHGAHSEACPV